MYCTLSINVNYYKYTIVLTLIIFLYTYTLGSLTYIFLIIHTFSDNISFEYIIMQCSVNFAYQCFALLNTLATRTNQFSTRNFRMTLQNFVKISNKVSPNIRWLKEDNVWIKDNNLAIPTPSTGLLGGNAHTKLSANDSAAFTLEQPMTPGELVRRKGHHEDARQRRKGRSISARIAPPLVYTGPRVDAGERASPGDGWITKRRTLWTAAGAAILAGIAFRLCRSKLRKCRG